MDKALYPIKEVARYVITYSMERQKPVSHLALQKILFFLQRKYLQEFHRPLFAEPMQAWQFGPVSPEIYFEYFVNGAWPIKETWPTSISVEDQKYMEPTIERYYTNVPWELIKETHAPGTSWSAIWNGGKGNHKEIPFALIERLG